VSIYLVELSSSNTDEEPATSIEPALVPSNLWTVSLCGSSTLFMVQAMFSFRVFVSPGRGERLANVSADDPTALPLSR
jgi:hypothetical protein